MCTVKAKHEVSEGLKLLSLFHLQRERKEIASIKQSAQVCVLLTKTTLTLYDPDCSLL